MLLCILTIILVVCLNPSIAISPTNENNNTVIFRIAALFHSHSEDLLLRAMVSASIEEVNFLWRERHATTGSSVPLPQLELANETLPAVENEKNMIFEMDQLLCQLLKRGNVVAVLQINTPPQVSNTMDMAAASGQDGDRKIPLGMQMASMDHYLQEISKDLQIPLLEFRPTWKHWYPVPTEDLQHDDVDSHITTDQQLPVLSINVHPTLEDLTALLSDLTERFQWSEFLLVHDDVMKMRMMEKLFELSDYLPQKHLSLRAKKFCPKEAYGVLQEIADEHSPRLLLDLEMPNLKLFLQVALNKGMVSRDYHYILTNLDAAQLDFENYRHNFANITLLTLKGVKLHAKLDSIMQTRRGLSTNSLQTLKNLVALQAWSSKALLAYDLVKLLHKAIDSLTFNEGESRGRKVELKDTSAESGGPCIALHHSSRRPQARTRANSSTGRALWHLLKDLSVEESESLSGSVSMYGGHRYLPSFEVLHVKNVGLETVGQWSRKQGLHMPTLPFDVKTVLPLKNQLVRVVTVLQKPFVQLKVDASSREGRDKFEGYCIDLMEHIANSSGFEWTIYVEPENTYGVYLLSEDADQQNPAQSSNSHHWNGMVRELLSGRAEIALGAFTISYSREKVIDFTKPFMNLGISILFKKPEAEKPGLFSFLNPLSIEIWLYVLAAQIIITLLIYTLARFSPYEWLNPHPCIDSYDLLHNSYTLSNSFWFTLGTLMQQGSDINPRAVSTRIVSGIWWFFTLIIISSYTANLAAFLTIDQPVSQLDSAEDLSRQEKITYGTLKGGSTMDFFRSSHIDTYKRMWEFMSRHPQVLTHSTDEGIQRVKEGGYAFLMESAMIEYHRALDEACELTQVGGLIDSKGYGLGVAPNQTRLLDEMTLRILELQRDQVLQELQRKWWRASGTCASSSKTMQGQKASRLDIDNVGGIFVVLVIGLTMAILVAGLEFLWKAKQNATADRKTIYQEMKRELSAALGCYSTSRRHTLSVCSSSRDPIAKHHSLADSFTSKCTSTSAAVTAGTCGVLQHARELRGSPTKVFQRALSRHQVHQSDNPNETSNINANIYWNNCGQRHGHDTASPVPLRHLWRRRQGEPPATPASQWHYSRNPSEECHSSSKLPFGLRRSTSATQSQRSRETIETLACKETVT